MLAHRPHPVALDDLGPGVLVEKGPHQGGLGDIGDQPGGQGSVGPGAGEVLAKAGAVVAGHPQNPPPEKGRGVKGGPHGQVAPLGVPPHPQPARVALGHLHQVVLGQGLGGDGEGIAHGKALLPPHQGVVGAPEGQVEGAVGQAEGEGGKLGLLVQHPAAQPRPRVWNRGLRAAWRTRAGVSLAMMSPTASQPGRWVRASTAWGKGTQSPCRGPGSTCSKGR